MMVVVVVVVVWMARMKNHLPYTSATSVDTFAPCKWRNAGRYGE